MIFEKFTNKSLRAGSLCSLSALQHKTRCLQQISTLQVGEAGGTQSTVCQARISFSKGQPGKVLSSICVCYGQRGGPESSLDCIRTPSALLLLYLRLLVAHLLKRHSARVFRRVLPIKLDRGSLLRLDRRLGQRVRRSASSPSNANCGKCPATVRDAAPPYKAPISTWKRSTVKNFLVDLRASRRGLLTCASERVLQG